MKNISSSDICSYFDLPDKNLNIQLSQKDTYFLLHFKYTKKIKYIQFRDLPEDINNEINSYLCNYIHVTYKVLFGNNYPISPPTWSLYSLDYKKYNTLYKVNVLTYYKYIIDLHNKRNDCNWTPAITLESDCLDLIILNNFEHFF
jgi:hypothetical protein